jgi:hypothetical protein
MAIVVITDSFESLNDVKSKVGIARGSYSTAEKAGVEAVIASVLHCQTHGAAEGIILVKEMLEDAAPKRVLDAFVYLYAKFTGAKKDGTIDPDRQNKGKALCKGQPAYMVELEAIDEMGLVNWHKDKLATPEETKAAAKTDAEKHAAKVAKAMELIQAEAKADTVQGVQLKAMLEYGAAFSEMLSADAGQAKEMHDAQLARFAKSVSNNIDRLKNAA